MASLWGRDDVGNLWHESNICDKHKPYHVILNYAISRINTSFDQWLPSFHLKALFLLDKIILPATPRKIFLVYQVSFKRDLSQLFQKLIICGKLNCLYGFEIIHHRQRYDYITRERWDRLMLCIILGRGLANERWCYIITLSFIGWSHTTNDPCIRVNICWQSWHESNWSQLCPLHVSYNASHILFDLVVINIIYISVTLQVTSYFVLL